MYTVDDLSVRIDWVLLKTTEPFWQDIRHNRSVHSFYWIHKGSGTFLCAGENEAHAVQKGMLFYMEPGLSMSMESSVDDPLQITMVLFQCSITCYENQQWKMPQQLARLNIPFKQQVLGQDALDLDDAFRQMVHSWLPDIPERNLYVCGTLMQILAKLHSPEQVQDPEGPEQAFQRIKRYMQQHYESTFRIGDLARSEGISVSYLRKLFIKHLSVSPKDYLIQIRMQHAERYLIFTRLPVHAIARSCGYRDEFQFSKAFSKHAGQSPLKFRKQTEEQ
ncbi:AraC family transcriptional regulator [Paenibacillus lemnae]|uniref:AraC family transcriptional regulator n=1 Tax=Paenibacillus lemnae TaxID=1330551 RepID=A0A848MD79_PAELE|nr:AraC family transcriptional regulator [Paenibacillus lemnae]NMO98199.1 AraC family transcriptional regulator [Paenibacillus lemnae]